MRGASRMAMMGGLLAAIGAGFKHNFLPTPLHLLHEMKPSRNNRARTHWARQQAKEDFRDVRLGKAFRQYRKRYAGY